MIAAPPAPVSTRPALGSGGLLLRLELRRNAMLWMLPLTVALFWFISYRRTMALPPLWNVRAMTLQSTALAVFVPTVVGAAAWMGSREGRSGISDLLAVTARPRWVRQLATWAATSCWAIVAYLGCVGFVYGATAQQAAWGGPLWWPLMVGVAGMPALSAVGFVAGVLLPSRFTSPLVAIGVFLGLEISLQMIHGGQSRWQISPLVAGPWELGTTDQGVATFYRYLPDLPIAQVIFLVGLCAALLGIMGLPAGSGGRSLRRSVAVLTLAGVLAAGTAVALAGTGRLDAHGLIAIPALHDTADDLPVRYTPACSHGVIPICVHPAYTVYLSAVAAALDPMLSEIAGLPGAPVRIHQATADYQQGAVNEVHVRRVGPATSGSPPVFHLLLPCQLPGPTQTVQELADTVRTEAGRDIVGNVIGDSHDPARQAVTVALLNSPADAPAQRFASLSPAVRRAWLVEHLTELRAGRITLAQLP